MPVQTWNAKIRAAVADMSRRREIAGASAVGEARGRDGMWVQCALKIEDGVLREAGFAFEGPDLLGGAMGTLLRLVEGQKADRAIESYWFHIDNELADDDHGVEVDERPMLALAASALRAAVRAYFVSVGKPLNEEYLLLCKCLGVPERDVKKAIAEGGLTKVDDVGDACDAGLGCETCHPDIQAQIDVFHASRPAQAG